MHAVLKETPFDLSIAEKNLPKPNILLCGELPVSVDVVDTHSPNRAELEHFVQHRFQQTHQATVTHFMPKLLSLRDNAQQLRAVCGLRHAHQEPLFLERYLDTPIEQALSTHVGCAIPRHQILEIGNLAVLEPACIRSLLASVSVYLHSTDAKWAVFTGITSLRNALNKLHMPLHILGEASIDALPIEERAAWGSYYAHRPQIMAIARMQ
jgi:hypothetical protein